MMCFTNVTSTGIVGVSLLLWLLARFSPFEWDNPYPCIEEPDELENQFNLPNAFWYVIGAIMQQGADVAPIALSTRWVQMTRGHPYMMSKGMYRFVTSQRWFH